MGAKSRPMCCKKAKGAAHKENVAYKQITLPKNEEWQPSGQCTKRVGLMEREREVGLLAPGDPGWEAYSRSVSIRHEAGLQWDEDSIGCLGQHNLSQELGDKRVSARSLGSFWLHQPLCSSEPRGLEALFVVPYVLPENCKQSAQGSAWRLFSDTMGLSGCCLATCPYLRQNIFIQILYNCM